MNDSKLESDCGLIISSEELIRIREACQRRRRELEAAGTLPPLTIAPGSSQSALATAEVQPPISEAERFATAVSEMPARIRAFFEHEHPTPPQQPESTQDRLERQTRVFVPLASGACGPACRPACSPGSGGRGWALGAGQRSAV